MAIGVRWMGAGASYAQAHRAEAEERYNSQRGDQGDNDLEELDRRRIGLSGAPSGQHA